MGWAKIDHSFFRHPKVVSVGKDAKFLYIAALCYCGENMTDGVVPAAALRVLGAEIDIKNPARAARELVASGLWIARNDAEFHVNDYLAYNESSDERKAKQEAARGRMQRTRSQNVRANNERSSGEVRELEEEVEEETEKEHTNTAPDGAGASDSSGDQNDEASKPKRPQVKYPADFEEFWQAYPSGHGNKGRSYDQWRRIRPDAELHAEIMAGIERWKRSDRWQRGFVKAAEVWLKDAWWANDPPGITPIREVPGEEAWRLRTAQF